MNNKQENKMKKNNFNPVAYLELLAFQIEKANPRKPRNKPYQIKADKLKEQLKPCIFWDSSTEGTYRKC